MLQKNNRLVKDQEIKNAYKTNLRIDSKYTKLFLKHNQTDKFQLLVVVSTKIHKKAHTRNKIKRRISAIFEHLRFVNRLPKNVSIIIQVKNQDIIKQTFETIKQDILPNIAKLFFKPNKNQNK